MNTAPEKEVKIRMRKYVSIKCIFIPLGRNSDVHRL